MLTCCSGSESWKSWLTLHKMSINMKSIWMFYLEHWAATNASNSILSVFVLTFVKYHAISYLITWIAIILAAMQSWFWRKSKKSAFCRRLIDKFARTAESAGSLRLLVKRHVKVHFVASLQNNRDIRVFIKPKSDNLSGIVSNWLTHSCPYDLNEVNLAVKDANSKLVAAVVIEESAYDQTWNLSLAPLAMLV